MGVSRIKGGEDGAGYYHVMSRTVSDNDGGLMLFGAHEKNVFAKQLRKHAEFAGIEVLTWCMMDNHFHLLIRVPGKDKFLEGVMADGRKKFWQHLRALYDADRVREVRGAIKKLEKGNHESAGRRVEEIVGSYTRRMADLSSFLRGLKHAFSVWYNRKYRREGTLWMERFKSVLLEGESWVLKKVAAYIDLNPIRAGLVDDPGRYRWSGYGQAVGGRSDARKGLSIVHGHERNEWRRISRDYRKLLYQEGVVVQDAQGRVLRTGFSTENSRRETAESGGENSVKRLSDRVRYFADGAAIGSREFLEHVFEQNRPLFGARRKSGARKFRGAAWKGEGMFALRDLDAGGIKEDAV